MVAPKTVFVVGAGASYEFGLPVGNVLKDQIAAALAFKFDGVSTSCGNADHFIYETLQTYTQVNRDKKFGELIKASVHISSAMPLAPSIDNFIHVHNGNREVEFCGKIAIAHQILRAEAGSKLRILPDRTKPNLDWLKETWIVSLMKMLGEDCAIEQLHDRLSNVKFIVFNYDRCIEHFLFHAIQIYYGVNDQVAADLVNSVHIYHPYGVVGKLPWQLNSFDDIKQSIDFGGNINQHGIIKIAGEIRTFTEGTKDEDSDIIAIRRSMEEAQRLVFLGFAYHPLNVALLGVGGMSRARTRRAFGTAFGMSKSDAEYVQELLSTHLHAPTMAVRNDITCANLFHEYSRGLSFV
jgi:hypothetical protein